MPLSVSVPLGLTLDHLGAGTFNPGLAPNALGFWDDTLSVLNTKSDLSGAVPNNADPVGYVSCVPATLAAGNMTQPTAGNRPTLTTGSGLTWGANLYVKCSPMALTGACTVYALGSRQNAGIWTLVGTDVASPQAFVGVFSDNMAYVVNDAGAFVNAAVVMTGTVLVRFRRDASNVCYVHFTGNGAETTIGTRSGLITVDTMAARVGLDSSSSNSFTRSLLVVNADTVTAGTDAAIRAWYSTNRSITIP